MRVCSQDLGENMIWAFILSSISLATIDKKYLILGDREKMTNWKVGLISVGVFGVLLQFSYCKHIFYMQIPIFRIWTKIQGIHE